MTIRNLMTACGAAACAWLAVGAAPAPAAGADLPTHPDRLQFPPLTYQAPRAAEYRVKLSNGAVAYLVTDRTLPMVTVSVMMRAGTDLDPAGKEGLAAMTMHLLTRSGSGTRNAKAIEDRVAFLGAQLGSGMGGGGGFSGPGVSEPNASINLLAKDLDEGLAILAECLRAPVWEAERLQLRKDELIQAMKQRNDDSGDIEEREWGYLMRGDAHYSNHLSTQASIEGITPADLAAFHRRYVGPKNFMIAVSGDFDRAAMVKKLEKTFAEWPSPGERPGPPPAPAEPARGGYFLVDKDVNQGRVSIGLRTLDRFDPDFQAARVMNDILGGGGFSSRLVNRIRSDEGLAYSVRSYIDGGLYYPDPWRIAFQSKVRTVAYAIQLAMNEVQRMRDTLVTPAELELTKNKFIESLPAAFETASSIATALATEEVTGRFQKDPAYFAEVRDRVRAVTAEDVQRVARRMLDPSKMTVLMVGNGKDILLGDPKHDAQITGMAGGEPTRLPLRDPMTLKPVPVP